jgi:hypothetical protein
MQQFPTLHSHKLGYRAADPIQLFKDSKVAIFRSR